MSLRLGNLSRAGRPPTLEVSVPETLPGRRGWTQLTLKRVCGLRVYMHMYVERDIYIYLYIYTYTYACTHTLYWGPGGSYTTLDVERNSRNLSTSCCKSCGHLPWSCWALKSAPWSRMYCRHMDDSKEEKRPQKSFMRLATHRTL